MNIKFKYIVILFFVCILNFSLYAAKEKYSVKGIEMDADIIEYLYKKKMIRADGNVIIKFQEMILKGEKAVYNKVNEILDLSGNITLIKGSLNMTCKKMKASQVKKKIDAIGDIKVTFKNIKITANKATFDTNQNIILIEDDVLISQYENQLRSEIVIFDLSAESLKTIGKSRVNIGL